MSVYKRVICLMSLVVLTSCSALGDFNRTAPPHVTLVREACFGTCPVYTLTLEADGTVEFVGREWVAHPGPHRAKLTNTEMARLDEALDRAEFDRLQPQYLYVTDGCGQVGTDASGVSITVVRDGVEKLVTCYFGCMGGSVSDDVDRIRQLADEIDAVVGTQRWVVEPPPRKGPLTVDQLRP